jgi:thymidylate kinase
VSAESGRPFGRRRAYVVVAAIVVALVAAMFAWRSRQVPRSATAAGARTSLLRREVRAPAGTRIRVQVLNATKTRGLARRATFFLRDRGFDVVETGTSSVASDSVVVLDRSGHPEWARLVAEAMGGARVESRPDSSRYLDVTVLLGASWRPPPKPLYP